MSKTKKHIDIIGVPSDLGANMRGSNTGPAAVRIADLKQKLETLGHQVTDKGDIHIPLRENISPEDRELRYLPQIETLCTELAKEVEQSIANDRIPISIGGDHSLAVGSISGVANHFYKKNKKIGLVWFDAHADINSPETSPSGNIHGMPLAALLGRGHEELTKILNDQPKLLAENSVLVGVRTIDERERANLKDLGVHCFTMREIDEKGMHHVMTQAIKYASAGTDAIHLSFDLDGIDPLYAPGVSTAVTGGLSFREAHLGLEMLADTGKVCAMDFVEVNPFTDRNNATARLAVDLIQSALGKSIL